MNCKNCGAILTGTENVCPNCGAPVENVVSNQEILQPSPAVAPEPVVAPQPVMEPTPVVPEQPVVAPEPVAAPEPVVETTPVVTPEPVVAPQPQAPTGFVEPAVAAIQPQAQAAPTEAKPKDNKTIILIIALVVVAIGAVVLYFTVLAPAPEASAPTGNDVNDTPVSTNTEKKENYAGYTFTIPDGYNTKTDAEYGLIINNASRAFSIAVDYTHSYDQYKTALVAKYPDQKDKLVATVDGREYLILVYTDDSGAKGSQYVTKANDNTTFIGMMVRSDYTQATTEDFSVVTEVINSATQGSSSFAPGDDLDAGKNGEKIYTFTKDKFSFEEKGE